MVDAEVAALAMAGSSALVAAMATDMWQSSREGLVRLFGRRGREAQAVTGTQLDDDAALLARSEDAARLREGLVTVWQLRLEDLLRRFPDAAEDLRALTEEIRAALPAREVRWVQTNTARDGGQVFASQGGNVTVHHTHGGGPDEGPDEGPDGHGPVASAQ